MQTLTAIATLVTAVAALLTILEMRWQRTSSYKPDLVVSDSPLVVYRMPDGGIFPFTFRTDGSRPSKESASSLFNSLPDVRCINVGVAQAKRVRYRWAFDAQQFIQQISAIDVDWGTKILVDRDVIRFEHPAIQAMFRIGSSTDERLTAVSPGGITNGTPLQVPFSYLALLSAYLQAAQSHLASTDSWTWSDPVALTLTLDYRDIGETDHRKQFQVSPHFVAFSHFAEKPAPQDPELVAQGYFQVEEA